ncbi:MAG TPA: hypothetical protein VGR36_08080 [Candidatus Acidoferrales bacterium]|nr:hypothetical protein [Candidatus Acidoferrales bacterium]
MKWNLSRQVEFVTYSGNLRDLRGPYDFVFTKSVLVVLGDQAAGIGGLLAETGEYIAVENMEGGWAVAGARRIIHRHWEGHRTYFKPLNRARISELASRFRSAESKEFLGLVVAIRARYPRPIS